MSDFFTELGKAASRHLAQNIDRGQLADMQRSALSNHISGPMARDSLPLDMAKDPPMTPNMKRILAHDSADLPIGTTDYNREPNGSQDPTNGGHGGSAEQCLGIVQQLIDGFDDPDEQSQFLEGLSNMVSGDEDMNGGRVNVPTNGDRRPARDQIVAANQGALDRRRRPAQDSNVMALNSSNFNKRWGALTKNITVMGRR
jgi:hypothetical protein